jgi:hypothetical protein
LDRNGSNGRSVSCNGHAILDVVGLLEVMFVYGCVAFIGFGAEIQGSLTVAESPVKTGEAVADFMTHLNIAIIKEVQYGVKNLRLQGLVAAAKTILTVSWRREHIV